MRRIFVLSALAAMLIAAASVAQEKAATPEKAAADKATYVGSTKCKMCHNKATLAIHTSWSATKHAAALASLEKADEKVTAEWAAKIKAEVKGPAAKADACLECHVVGHGKGGYPTGDAAKDAAFTGVGCESCHGPGSKHVAAPAAEKKKAMQPLPTVAACKGCHTEATSPKFNYDEALKAGVPHARKAAAAKG